MKKPSQEETVAWFSSRKEVAEDMSKLDPIKVQGKIREQMNREIKARREYAKKYFFMSKPEINQFYDQSFLSAKVNEAVPENLSDASSSVGDSYFVSKAMFDSLNVCRCGRKKAGTHLTKCMQKCVIKYSETEQESLQQDIEQSSQKPNIPKTSNSLTGFFECKYKDLEKSTNYVLPKPHLKYKITDSIYDNIIIG